MNDVLKSRIAFQIGLGIGVGALSVIAGYFYCKKKKQLVPPKKWRLAGTLEEIVYYPLKACSGIVLQKAECTTYGIKSGNFCDRMLMLFDSAGKVGFGGAYPKLWLIKTEEIDENLLKVTAPDMEPLMIDFNEIGNGDVVKVTVYENKFSVIECGSKYEKWFSNYLLGKDEGMKLRLSIDPVPEKGSEGFNFFMLFSSKSMDDLNSRLQTPVHHWQFRGNFLIKTNGPAYEEDNWRWVKIGDDTILKYNAPCYRCILPNINPFTAERSADFEPIKTLQKYRVKSGSKQPIMGTYFNLYASGLIKKGDNVYVA